MDNLITFRLCDEDRTRLDRIIEGLEKLSTPFMGVDLAKNGTGEDLEARAQEVLNEIPAGELDFEEIIGEEDPVYSEPSTPAYTLDDIRGMVQKLAAPTSNKREEVKAIVKSYAAKVSDIPADKYSEVMQKLTDLDKEG